MGDRQPDPDPDATEQAVAVAGSDSRTAVSGAQRSIDYRGRTGKSRFLTAAHPAVRGNAAEHDCRRGQIDRGH